MAALATLEPKMQQALEACIHSLRRLANYELDSDLNQRLLDLGERKDQITKEEHRELIALVNFTQRRSLEKLEAQLALQRLQEIVPDLVTAA